MIGPIPIGPAATPLRTNSRMLKRGTDYSVPYRKCLIPRAGAEADSAACPLLQQAPSRWLASAFALAFLALSGARADNLDRIAVTVGRHVITESDVLLDLRISAFLDGKPPDLSGAQKRKAADRLVDQYLVLEDAAATRAPAPSAPEIAALIEPVRAPYASESEYRAALERAGITEAQLETHLAAGLRMMRYTGLRFRPEVQIADRDLREAFDALVAKRPAGSPAPTFEASRDRLEELLINQRVLEALDQWLAMTRAETQILFKDAAFR